MPPVRIASTILLALVLVGCGAPNGPDVRQLERLTPSDAHVAKLYRQSCKACHARPSSGAPLVHDHAAWDPRWAKGLPVLEEHAIVGFLAMPAGGQCAVCTPRDYDDLIRFMADQEGR